MCQLKSGQVKRDRETVKQGHLVNNRINIAISFMICINQTDKYPFPLSWLSQTNQTQI